MNPIPEITAADRALLQDTHQPRVRIPPSVIAAIAIVDFYTVWQWFLLRINDGSDESWGLIALLTAAIFIGKKIQRSGRLALGWNAVSIFAAALYVFGFTVLTPMIRAAVAIVFLCAFFRIDRIAPGICGLLLISLPVIASAQFYPGYPLRLITAASMEFLLNLCSIDGEISRHGTVLWWQNAPIGVDPPCSGIRMPWAGFFLHFVLATFHRHSWRVLAILTPLAGIAIIIANIARGFLLFFKETEIVLLPDWTHVGIGVVLFAALAFGWSKLSAQFQNSTIENTIPDRKQSFLSIALILAAISITPLAVSSSTEQNPTSTAAIQFPETFENEHLIPIPLSETEQRFASAFPGEIGVFKTTTGTRIILRHVEKPTRKLHSSADRLRASGYHLKNHFSETLNGWTHWKATHPDWGTWQVHEQISETQSAKNWSDISSWFWAASFKKTKGPWLAVTVMEPVYE
ncbi:MAG: archaeosortase/exosortase family protein [Verrucomicrobiales bacterium]